ncbi:hypothetical protein BKA62DRAFT_617878 [Auriculariales sp. MPI-PUGE-AT-0066]|nr:hypothetical protein BKA62DRAFT_617878 [Auriculariales sp. MPI-PUGE-AT-0066]
MNTITITLVTVLLVQLVFTSQYHWPLARLNFLLQLGGVLSLLVSLIATLFTVLNHVYEQSREWPYMLSYIAVTIPPNRHDPESILQWTSAQHISWALMEALVSGLVHMANIQYLTLLYPSRFERWLISGLLVPLAIGSSAMEISHLHSNESVRHAGDTARNICNCTLALLFTFALCMWGLIVHRKQAWRTDGGTAIFGGGAILLAAVSSALNIIIIPAKDQLYWLQSMVWSVVLWQSFLGWWWWVGCAVESNNVEDMIVRERKRGARRARKKLDSETSLRSGVSRVMGTLRSRARPSAVPSTAAPFVAAGAESIEMSNMASRPHAPPPASTSSRGDSSSLSTAHSGMSWWTRFWRSIRREHETAALEQALELTANGNPGWGLGSFATRERGAAATRVRELRDDEDGEARGIVGAGAEPGASVVSQAPAYEQQQQQQQPNSRDHRPASMYWWGPLVRWRLQDRTVY